jgi:predicted secreted hydrolase
MPKPIYAASDEELARLGITEVVEPWEDGFRTDTGREYFEWWYFDAHLDDGSTAVIVFITKEIMERKGPLRPGLKMTITRPDGVKLSASPFFPPDEFTASKQSCDVKIGPNWVHGDLHTYQLHAEANGMSADLTFTGIVPPWRPLDGKAYFGDREHYFGWLPAIPYGTVQGTLTYDGKTHNVTGSGYHDHNWGNLSLPNVIDHWYWGRAQFGDYTVPSFCLQKGRRY